MLVKLRGDSYYCTCTLPDLSHLVRLLVFLNPIPLTWGCCTSHIGLLVKLQPSKDDSFAGPPCQSPLDLIHRLLIFPFSISFVFPFTISFGSLSHLLLLWICVWLVCSTVQLVHSWKWLSSACWVAAMSQFSIRKESINWQLATDSCPVHDLFIKVFLASTTSASRS